MNEMKPSEMQRALEEKTHILIDVREICEYELEHVEGAKHIPKGELKDKIVTLDIGKDQPIILMCASGNRSSQSVAILEYLGYTKVFNLKGGLKGWKSAGL